MADSGGLSLKNPVIITQSMTMTMAEDVSMSPRIPSIPPPAEFAGNIPVVYGVVNKNSAKPKHEIQEKQQQQQHPIWMPQKSSQQHKLGQMNDLHKSNSENYRHVEPSVVVLENNVEDSYQMMPMRNDGRPVSYSPVLGKLINHFYLKLLL